MIRKQTIAADLGDSDFDPLTSMRILSYAAAKKHFSLQLSVFFSFHSASTAGHVHCASWEVAAVLTSLPLSVHVDETQTAPNKKSAEPLRGLLP